jgi:hypothetical protein
LLRGKTFVLRPVVKAKRSPSGFEMERGGTMYRHKISFSGAEQKKNLGEE